MSAVVPIALGAAVAASAAVLKAKCTFMVGANECSTNNGCAGAREGKAGKDHWAPKVLVECAKHCARFTCQLHPSWCPPAHDE